MIVTVEAITQINHEFLVATAPKYPFSFVNPLPVWTESKEQNDRYARNSNDIFQTDDSPRRFVVLRFIAFVIDKTNN